MAITSRWIDIPVANRPDDAAFQGYLALPGGVTNGKGPAILLLQEIFGVNEHIRAVADAYAADGYVVLAPDLFWRSEQHVELNYDEAGRDRGVALMQATPIPTFVSDLSAALTALRALPDVTGKVAVVGYCFGGLLAYLTAANGGADAAVAYYGGGIPGQLDLAPKVTVPMLFHFGEKDSHIPLDGVAKIEETFKTRDDIAVHVYPGAEHGFNAMPRGSYQQRASALARGRTLTFLAETL